MKLKFLVAFKRRPKLMETISLNPKQVYWNLYPMDEEVFIESIKEDGDAGLILILGGHKNISYFLYCLNGDWIKSKDGAVKVHFKSDSAEAQYLTLKVKGILRDGGETKVYTATIGYYPSALYRAHGHTSPSWIIIQRSDLNLLGSKVEDWVTDEISEEDKLYAVKTWGSIISQASTDFEAAKNLAKRIIDDLEPHRGIPSDEMSKISPFKQFERAVSGRDRVWCGNISAIYSCALNALGIPCRRIGMNHQLTSGEKRCHILLAEGHSTVEFFSQSMGKWIWVDPTFRILGSYIGDIGPLNMIQFHIFLNDKELANNIRLIEYDPNEKREKIVSFKESKNMDALLKYFKADQIFRFYKRSAGKSG
jgi:hypothetical protein